MIVFSGLEFLFRFLPIFLLVYYITPARYRNAVLFLGSIVFYAFGEPAMVGVLLAMVVLNYVLAGYGKTGWRLMIILNIGVLVTAKALALLVPSIHLPLGISFYIFKMISFQADLHSGKLYKRPSFYATAAYFTMFPQITQGPIMRCENESFLAPRKIRISDIDDGLTFLCMGMSLKVLVADRIGILWNELFKIGYEAISTPLAWLGAFGYTFQLYFDFWGYSLMAAGIGMMLGFPFVKNFDDPYSANGVADFYRRWHVTLGAFFRDYVYIPLGGSREGGLRTAWNLMIVWALTGIWHGGTVNFLIWGFVLGGIILAEKFVLADVMKKHAIIGRLHVWILIPLTWVIFAIPDLTQLQIYFARLFPFFGIGETINPQDIIKYTGVYWPYFVAAVGLCLPAVSGFILRNRKRLPMKIAIVTLFWLAAYYSALSSGNAFMYFSF